MGIQKALGRHYKSLQVAQDAEMRSPNVEASWYIPQRCLRRERSWVEESKSAKKLSRSVRHASDLLLRFSQLVWARELGTRLASLTLYTLAEQYSCPPRSGIFLEGWMNRLHQVCPVPHGHAICIIYARCLSSLRSVPVITADQSERAAADQPREQLLLLLSSAAKDHAHLKVKPLERNEKGGWPHDLRV